MIIRDNNIQKWLFDYFEGNLTPHEEVELNNFISQNPSYQGEFDAWQKSYPSKEVKSKRNRVPVYAGASSLLVETSIWARLNWKHAAVIITLIGGGSLIGFYNSPSETVSNNETNLSENNISTTTSNLNVTDNNSESIEIFDTDSDNLDNKKNSSNSIDNLANNYASNNLTSSGNDGLANQSNSSNQSNKIDDPNNFNNSTIEKENSLFQKQSLILATNVSNSEKGVNEIVNHNDIDFSSNTSKVKSIPVVIFNNEVERSVNKDFSRNEKNKKRYFYTGFKDLAGRGIGVRNKKSKIDKGIKQEKNESDENFFITENGGGDKHNDDPDRNHKRKSHRNSEIALMNLYDPIFITTNSHPLSVNAALAGELGVPRIKSSFRLQNTNSNDVLMSAVSSYDMYIEGLKAGVGVVVSNNRLNDGLYSDNTIEVIYAQKFEISRDASFTAAIKYKGIQNRMNLSKMNFNSQIEIDRGITLNTFSDVPTNISTKNFKNDIGIATWYDGKHIYGGIEVDNILHSKTHVYNELGLGNRLPTTLSVQMGTDYRKSLYSDIVISPQVNFNLQKGLKELWVGSTVKYRSIVAGLGVGTLNSTSFKGTLGVQNHAVRLMYGFDYSKSALEGSMFASHEVSLRVLLGVKRKNWSRFKI